MSRKTKITTLFVAVATAAVFTASASGIGARMDNGAYGNGGVAGEAAVDTSNIPYLSHGVGITREAPTQATPIFRDTADGATLQRGFTVEVSVASSSSSVDWSEVATGLAFGLLLAALGATSLLMLRQRTLRTQ